MVGFISLMFLYMIETDVLLWYVGDLGICLVEAYVGDDGTFLVKSHVGDASTCLVEAYVGDD
jgi:hypothetical protein